MLETPNCTAGFVKFHQTRSITSKVSPHFGTKPLEGLRTDSAGNAQSPLPRGRESDSCHCQSTFQLCKNCLLCKSEIILISSIFKPANLTSFSSKGRAPKYFFLSILARFHRHGDQIALPVKLFSFSGYSLPICGNILIFHDLFLTTCRSAHPCRPTLPPSTSGTATTVQTEINLTIQSDYIVLRPVLDLAQPPEPLQTSEEFPFDNCKTSL